MDPVAGISSIKTELEEQKLLPLEIELAQFGDFYFSNIKMKDFGGVISESVVCGFDQSPELAVLKSFSEYVEALSFQAGARNRLSSCMTERSDGFAAFQKFDPDYQKKARTNALNEAIERFVWAKWWDDPQIGFDLENIDFHHQNSSLAALLKQLSKMIEIESVVSIRPRFARSESIEVMVLIAFLKGGGAISGGACGEIGSVSLRAVSELIRHGIATQRFKTKEIDPMTFYERRLVHFLGNDGERTVRERLNQRGSSEVQLPSLHIDESVPSVLPKSIHVHRCLFEDQLPFIGGALERFCL